MREFVRLYAVSGSSMEPSLKDGDLLITTDLLAPSIGAVVVVDHPLRGRLVKRVAAILPRKHGDLIRLTSDNPAAEDIGLVDSRHVQARVLLTVSGHSSKSRHHTD